MGADVVVLVVEQDAAVPGKVLRLRHDRVAAGRRVDKVGVLRVVPACKVIKEEVNAQTLLALPSLLVAISACS